VAKVQLAAGLSAGRSRMRAVVCAVEDSCLRFLGSGEAASRGWNRGRIADPEAISTSMAAAIGEAERRAGVHARGYVLGIGGEGVQGKNARGLYEFGHKREIVPEDLDYVILRATQGRLDEGRVILQVLPQDFILDGRAGYRNPRGLYCTRLEANVHLVTAPGVEHHALVSALQQAGKDVEESVFDPVAAAYAAILPEERNRGVALIDIGLQSTGVAIFDGESLLVASSLAVSSDHLTRDLAWCLRVQHGLSLSYEDAENLKRECGCAIRGLTADNSLVEVPSPDGRPPQEIPCREINEILQARAEELFHYVAGEIRRAGMDQALIEGVFLAGGGARLTGMCDMAEFILNCQARFALAVGIEDWPAELEDPAWTPAAGLAMYSARLKLDRDFERKAPGLLGLVLR